MNLSLYGMTLYGMSLYGMSLYGMTKGKTDGHVSLIIKVLVLWAADSMSKVAYLHKFHNYIFF